MGQVAVHGRRHRRVLHRRSLYVYSQARGLGGFCGGASEGGHGYLALIEVREILHQRLYALRTEEHEHVVVEGLVGSEVVADCAIHSGPREFQVERLKIGSVAPGVDVRHREKEILVLVLEKLGLEALEFARRRGKNLALAVDDIFL